MWRLGSGGPHDVTVSPSASTRRGWPSWPRHGKAQPGACGTAQTDFQYAVARPGKSELLKAKEIAPPATG